MLIFSAPHRHDTHQQVRRIALRRLHTAPLHQVTHHQAQVTGTNINGNHLFLL